MPSGTASFQRGPLAPPRVPLLAVVLLLFGSTAIRFPGPFLNPAFWAEDGLFFFRNSVEMGPSAILVPMYGSYHLLPRSIAFLVAWFPTYWAPLLYAVAAGLLSSVSLSLFSRAGHRWLVPDDRLRVVVCWLFSLVPGTYESYFTLCGVNYALFCGLLFLLLERDPEGRWQMGWPRALLISLLWFSVGQGVVLAALVLYLFWLTRNRTYLLCLATLGAATLLNVTTENVYRPEVLPGPRLLAVLYLENLAMRLGFISVIPYRWHGVVRQMPDVAFWLLSGALIAGWLWAAMRAQRRDPEGVRVLATAVLSAMAIYPLSALARYYGVVAFSREQATFGGRFGWIPAVLALLLAWQWLAQPRRTGPGRVAAAGFLAWATFCILHEPYYQPPHPPVAPAGEWQEQSAIIDAALRARRAGTLTEAVVIKRVLCRPTSPPGLWRIRRLTIGPEEASSSEPSPPRM